MNNEFKIGINVIELKSEFEFNTNKRKDAQNLMAEHIRTISGIDNIHLKNNHLIILLLKQFIHMLIDIIIVYTFLT